jgi:hypothetical protein
MKLSMQFSTAENTAPERQNAYFCSSSRMMAGIKASNSLAAIAEYSQLSIWESATGKVFKTPQGMRQYSSELIGTSSAGLITHSI